ncbi:Hsp70 family protein [Mycolicibacterium elephantis]
MSDPLGLSIGTTNLVAARVGNQPVTRRSVLAHSDGTVLSGFVERVGDAVPLVAADGTSHPAEQLLVDALTAVVQAGGGQPPADIAVAVPAHWGPAPLRALRTAMRASPVLAPDGRPPRLLSDAVAALTALNVNPGLTAQGVVALLDFGGGGTSITLADAGARFEPIDETTRYAEFSGDQIDQALLGLVLGEVGRSGEADPSGTAAVGSLTVLRDECRRAKERLSTETTTDIVAELPGYNSTVEVSRSQLESLLAEPLTGVLDALDDTLRRNRIDPSDLSAVVAVGGGASIPLIGRRLAEHTSAPVLTTPQPAFDAAVGAALYAAYGVAADAETGVAPAPLVDARTGVAPVPPVGADAPGSSTMGALAWSQDDDGAEEPVPYTGAEPYDTGLTASRPPVQYVPPTGPIEEPRTWQRLPVLVFGVAAAVALIAVGGVAIALTSASDSTSTPEAPPTPAPPNPPASPLPPTDVAPPPGPPVETVTVTSDPPPPPETTQAPPPTTTRVTTTTTPPTPSRRPRPRPRPRPRRRRLRRRPPRRPRPPPRPRRPRPPR